jgi:DNA-binding transcriptional LysR family regulator
VSNALRGRGLGPSEEGRRAVPRGGEPSGTLRGGSLEKAVTPRLRPTLAGFAAACPKADLPLRTGTTVELVDAVPCHRLEGALVPTPVGHRKPVIDDELVLSSSPRRAGAPGR